jgi:hypothetical protein
MEPQEFAGNRTDTRPGKRKKDIRIETWNVLGLYRGGYLKKLIDQVHIYKVDVTAIQEARWICNGIIEKKDQIFPYSCNKKKHVFGNTFVANR